MSTGGEAWTHGNSRNRKRAPRGISGREAWAGRLQADGKEPQMRAEDCCRVTGPPPPLHCTLERQHGAVVQIHRAGPVAACAPSAGRRRQEPSASASLSARHGVAFRPGERAFGSVWDVTPQMRYVS